MSFSGVNAARIPDRYPRSVKGTSGNQPWDLTVPSIGWSTTRSLQGSFLCI